MDKHRGRLQRLRDRLEDMDGKWEPFGFGILQPSPAARVSLATWELAEDACKPHFDRCDGRLHRPRRWLDITPDGTYCIQWWGDKDGVEAFKRWADDVQVAFRQAPTAPELFVPSVRPVPPASAYSFEPSPWKPPSGYYWTLNALAMFAIQNPHITRTHEQVAHTEGPVELQVIPTRRRSLRDDGHQEDPPVTILYLEIEADAVALGLRSLNQLITKDIPSLHVDVENGVIYVKGIPVAVDRLQARAVEVLVAANGAWVTAKEIIEKLNLDEDERIDRTIFKKLPRPVKEQIESSGFSGRRIQPAVV
jgi:hypothetical protein